MIAVILGMLLLVISVVAGPACAFAGMTVIFVATIRQSAKDGADRRPMRRK